VIIQRYVYRDARPRRERKLDQLRPTFERKLHQLREEHALCKDYIKHASSQMLTHRRVAQEEDAALLS